MKPYNGNLLVQEDTNFFNSLQGQYIQPCNSEKRLIPYAKTILTITRLIFVVSSLYPYPSCWTYFYKTGRFL